MYGGFVTLLWYSSGDLVALISNLPSDVGSTRADQNSAIPLNTGKPRVFMPYANGLNNYRDECETVAAGGYTGFKISS